jgi:hypothetical protein
MYKEHLIHFKIIRKGEVKLLRGLVFLEEGKEPTIEDYERCLQDCGHTVQIENKKQYIFKAINEDGEYLIDILEDFEETSRDTQLEKLAYTFVKNTDPA